MSSRKSKQITQAFSLFQDAVKASGIQPEQLTNFLKAGYVPQRKQMEFHAACRRADDAKGPEKIGFGGARGGGKTAASFAQVALDDCQRMPGLKCLFLRKVSKAARESVDDLRRRFLAKTAHGYKSQVGVIEFPNSSRIFIGHFANERDIDSYLGLEYDLIAIEEDTQLSNRKKQDIITCLRTSKRGWRPRSYHTTNPGGIDHAGFKREFILPWRNKKQAHTLFVPSTVYDNAAIDPGYRLKLERLTGWQRGAWLLGDWDIAAGQYFKTWRHEIHVMKEPMTVPRHWPMWAAMDYGYVHPTVVYLATENDGMIYIVGEHCEAGLLPRSHAVLIREMLARHGRDLDDLDTFTAGEDLFQQKGDQEAKTIAEQYREQGIFIDAAPMDRVSGWSEILRLLGDESRGIRHGIEISPDCMRLIECIPAMIHNPNRVEDILKVNITEEGVGGDDPIDAARYLLMTRLVGEPDEIIVGGERNQLTVR